MTTYRLRPNADLDHESAEDWYDNYGWHLSPEAGGGDVPLQAVKWEWLNNPSNWSVMTQLIDYWPTLLTEDEAERIVAKAREVRLTAEEVEQHLDAAVNAYEAGHLGDVLDSLNQARLVELDHGASPATDALEVQLVIIKEED